MASHIHAKFVTPKQREEDVGPDRCEGGPLRTWTTFCDLHQCAVLHNIFPPAACSHRCMTGQVPGGMTLPVTPACDHGVVMERNDRPNRRCDGNNPILTIWNDAYTTDAASTNSTSKQRLVIDVARADGLIELRAVPFDANATLADIATVHDAAFVEAVKTGQPRHLAQSQGFTWSRRCGRREALIWSGHIEACRAALQKGMVLHPVSGAHHAATARDRDSAPSTSSSEPDGQWSTTVGSSGHRRS